MRRFLINNKDVNERKIWLCGEESHHLTAVLKCAEGEEIELFDGSGTLLTGVIEQTGKKVLVRIVSRVQPSNQKQRSLYLYQADLKGKNMDFIIQKAVELGVERVFPFTCSRSQGRVNQERRRKKLERWQKIIQAACKQSGRLTLMKCEEEMELVSLLDSGERQQSGLKLLFWIHQILRIHLLIYRR